MLRTATRPKIPRWPSSTAPWGERQPINWLRPQAATREADPYRRFLRRLRILTQVRLQREPAVSVAVLWAGGQRRLSIFRLMGKKLPARLPLGRPFLDSPWHFVPRAGHRGEFARSCKSLSYIVLQDRCGLVRLLHITNCDGTRPGGQTPRTDKRWERQWKLFFKTFATD